jgi:hypothetical protein
VSTNSDALFEVLQTKFNARRKNEESFLKFDRYTTVIWYIQFIQLIINLNKENEDRQSLNDYLKDYYANNRFDLEKVLEFERVYSPSTAIDWYTRDSFVYRILNKAFRLFDIKILILFRFFIHDLYQQLNKLYDKKNTPREVRCYRGQIMHKNEIEALEKDQRVCSTSFLSTTCNREMALKIFAGAFDPRQSNDDLQLVLFNIRPFHFNYNRSILADITGLSHFSDAEQEILFAVGTCFRIDRIYFDDEIAVWIIDLEEDYVENKINDSNRSCHVDIITIGFYLLVQHDNFQSVQIYYEILLNQANNSPLWILSCHVGLSLIQYYKRNYQTALDELWNVINIIGEQNLWKTCQIIGNIYCILANVYRDMDDCDMALNFYMEAQKTKTMTYFIKEKHQFWEMFIYKDKLNPFIKEDKYFYYCDRLNLNMMLLYKRSQQWHLARDTFQKVLDEDLKYKLDGKTNMFIKILQYNDNGKDLINKNREFSKFLDEHHKEYVLYAYEELGRHYLNHIDPDYAYLFYQEILQGEITRDSLLNYQCFEGIGRVYEMKQEYIEAINWFKKAMDISIQNISSIDSGSIRTYKKILLIFNEKLDDPLLLIVYMKQIINNLIKIIDNVDNRNDLIATIYKITIQFYHFHDKTKIELICDYILQVLDKIKINNKKWKKWLCIGSICNMETFKDDYHNICNPIIDENYNVYLKLYKKIYDILSHDTTDKFKIEISQCKQFLGLLTIAKLDL